MPKKNKTHYELGNALIKTRFGSNKNFVQKKSKMSSVLEETDFEKIVHNVEAERVLKNTIKIVRTDRLGILEEDDRLAFEEVNRKYQNLMSIPRRPANAKTMTKEDLHTAEAFNFNMWRMNLSEIESNKQVVLTPYECNLDFWRQLWRVVERSDILIQVVDARNPLLFRNRDLEKYVNEVDEHKINMILINKSDFLTENQRDIWSKYFNQEGIRIVFYSAKLAEESKVKAKLDTVDENVNEDVNEDVNKDECDSDVTIENESNDEESDNSEVDYVEVSDEHAAAVESDGDVIRNNTKILSPREIVKLLEDFHLDYPQNEGKVIVGFIGYPNVGKSSAINSIYGSKKVSVSATPGHTKRFQTLEIPGSEKLEFCDCPGLVMPSIVHSKAELSISGIIPIDTMRDFVSPMNLVASQFPGFTFEALYGMFLPSNIKDRQPTGREVLSTFSFAHGMMGSKGNPNLDKAARVMLKDYVSGKLLYRYPPPDISPEEFDSAAKIDSDKLQKHVDRLQKKESQPKLEDTIPIFDCDKSKVDYGCGAVINNSMSDSTASLNGAYKPWRDNIKVQQKHRRVKKLRREFRDLDVHTYVAD